MDEITVQEAIDRVETIRTAIAIVENLTTQLARKEIKGSKKVKGRYERHSLKRQFNRLAMSCSDAEREIRIIENALSRF